MNSGSSCLTCDFFFLVDFRLLTGRGPEDVEIILRNYYSRSSVVRDDESSATLAETEEIWAKLRIGKVAKGVRNTATFPPPRGFPRCRRRLDYGLTWVETQEYSRYYRFPKAEIRIRFAWHNLTNAHTLHVHTIIIDIVIVLSKRLHDKLRSRGRPTTFLSTPPSLSSASRMNRILATQGCQNGVRRHFAPSGGTKNMWFLCQISFWCHVHLMQDLKQRSPQTNTDQQTQELRHQRWVTRGDWGNGEIIPSRIWRRKRLVVSG